MKLAALLLLPIFLLYFFAQPVDALNIKINEFLAHPNSGNQEWVEFYNPDSTDLSPYFLDDDTDFANDDGNSNKKSLSAINNSSPLYPYIEFGSFLNNDSDFVVLFASDGSIVDQYQYASDPGSEITIGRYPDNSGQFTLLASQTKGGTNSSPLPTPTPTPNPTPTPSSTPNPTPTPTATPAPKTPTPAPIKSPTPKPSPKPSPSQTPSTLGESTSIASPDHSPTPTSEPAQEGSISKTKIAIITTGAGAILIAFSIGFYLWYSKVLGQGKAEDLKEVEEVT